MEDYAGRVLADRYRLPRPPADAYDIVETRAFDTYSGQEVTVRHIPLPETVEAEMPGPDGSWGAVRNSRATRRPGDPVVRRALDAATAAAAVPDHPRLDQVFDVFAEDGGLWIVSEYVPGRPLAALLAEDTLSPHRAAEVAADILTALRALHAQGWVHRNITARTVLVCDDGRAVLTGLAAGAAEEALCGYDPTPPADGEPGDGPGGGPGDGSGGAPGDGSGDGEAEGGPGGGSGGGHGPGMMPGSGEGGSGERGPGGGGSGGDGSGVDSASRGHGPGSRPGAGTRSGGTAGTDAAGHGPHAAGPGQLPALPDGRQPRVRAVAAYSAGARAAARANLRTDGGIDGGANGGGGADGRGGTGRSGPQDLGPVPAPHLPGQGQHLPGQGPQLPGQGQHLPGHRNGGQPGGPQQAGGFPGGPRQDGPYQQDGQLPGAPRQDGSYPTGQSVPGQSAPGQSAPGQPAFRQPGPGHDGGGGPRPASGAAASGAVPGQPLPGRPALGGLPGAAGLPPGFLPGGEQGAGPAASGRDGTGGTPGIPGPPGPGPLGPGPLGSGALGQGALGSGPPGPVPGEPGLAGSGGVRPLPGRAGVPGQQAGQGRAGTPAPPGAVQAGWHGSTGRPGQPGRPAPEPESRPAEPEAAPEQQRPNRPPAGPRQLPARYDRPTEEESYDRDDSPHDDPQDPGGDRTAVQPYGPGGTRHAQQPYGPRDERPAGQHTYEPRDDRPTGQQPYARQPHAQQPHAQQPYAQQPHAQQPYEQGAPRRSDPQNPDSDRTAVQPYEQSGRGAVQPYDRRAANSGQSQDRAGSRAAVQPYEQSGRGTGDDRAARSTTGGPGGAPTAQPGPGSAPANAPAANPRTADPLPLGAGTTDPRTTDPRTTDPRTPTPEPPAASRWDDLVAAGRGPGGLRGPATPLAAERARQARMVVVGAVTERWAPEQAGPVRGNWQLAAPVGPATDLWAVGALLFRAVQGHAPYPEESAAELVRLVCTEAPAFAEECGALRPVVESLLRQDPTERPEFEELRGWLRSLIRTAPEPDLGSRTVTVPSGGTGDRRDPRRLPVLRRRGELVRRRRGAAQAVVHGRHKRAKEHRRGPRALGRTLLVLILLALAGAIAYAMLFMPRAGETGDRGADRTGAAGAASSAPGAPPADPGDDADDADENTGEANGGSGERETSGTPQTSAPANLAKGFEIRKDPAGFQVAVHEDWQRQGENSLGQIRYTRGRFELVVVPGRDGVDEFGADPMAYQQDAERELASFRESQWSSASGLRRIDVGDTAMAEGAFTWRDDSDREVHTRNLAMILDGRYHVVQVTGPVADKQEVAHHFEQATATYRTTG